jgi:ubiquinone/menaquinone biosynthesis C-methylase UbiE
MSVDLPEALPKTWPDHVQMWRPSHFVRVVRKLFGLDLGRVELPEGLALRVPLPKYLLLEFHNLPNGNYSNDVTRAYSVGFDMAMLGEMTRARAALASALKGCREVLDVGCGAGGSTATIRDAGAERVVGLEASPYLVRHAQTAHPDLTFLQGLAEDTRLPSQSFDGVAACFLFHELPAKYADKAIAELKRVLKPKGRIAILEPAREQMCEPLSQLLKRFGWRGFYFWLLARWVHEPFVRAWHAREPKQWLRENGFNVVEERLLFPSRMWVAELA